jgi:hypothetical protein
MGSDTQPSRGQALEAGALVLAAMSFYTAIRVRDLDRGEESARRAPQDAASGADHSGYRGDGVGRTRAR